MKIKLPATSFMILVLMMACGCIHAQVTSTFDTNNDGWRVTGDATSSTPQYFSTNGNPGGYVSSTDAATGGVWYWSAPAKFLGNQASAFGKMLQFDLKQSSLSNQFNAADIIIIGSGDTIVLDLAQNPLTTWTHYNVPLNTGLGWRMNALAGSLATDEAIQNILMNISSLRIRGEYVSGSDRGDLDNVVLPSTSILPLQLLSFTGELKNSVASLSWVTSNEVNNSHFDVQYGIDGLNFKTVGTVAAAGSGNNQHNYYWNQKNEAGGNHFYRLKLTDKTGSFQFSPILKLQAQSKILVGVFPNPATDRCVITGLEANYASTLQLINMSGAVLLEQKVKAQSATMNMSCYPSGNYFVRIQSGTQFQQLKIIKQ
ncbi:MAG: laminin B domain-containing protein [Chitinophagaceae bacterium]